MTGETDEQFYAVLQVQEQHSAMRHDTRDCKGELIAIPSYMDAVHEDIGNIDATLGYRETRLERIERRLELPEAELAL